MKYLRFFSLLLTACDMSVIPPGGDKFQCIMDFCNNHGICDDNAGDPICFCNEGYTGDHCETCADQFIEFWDGECRPAYTKLTASDAQPLDRFGGSVSIDGNMAFVGAPNAGGLEQETGAVYFFLAEGETWVEKQKLTACDAQKGDSFGYSVSLSGELVIVGTPFEDGDDNDSRKNAGAAYIFQLEEGQWVEKQKLIASDAQPNDHFGSSVSIYGDLIVVGAPKEDGAIGNPADWHDGPGAAYIFQLDSGKWSETGKLDASDDHLEGEFGGSVAIDERFAVVGAPGSGETYLFQLEEDSWLEKRKLTDPDGKVDSRFGNSVSISGELLVIGAPFDEYGTTIQKENAGAAYIFHLEKGQWINTQRLASLDPTANDEFGYSVAISGEIVVVGARGDDGSEGNHIEDAGAAYIFVLENETWVGKNKLYTADAQKYDKLGSAVSVSRGAIIVGALWKDQVGET